MSGKVDKFKCDDCDAEFNTLLQKSIHYMKCNERWRKTSLIFQTQIKELIQESSKDVISIK